MPCCSIITCRKRSQDCNLSKGNISYHRFPSEPNLKEKWILATGRGNWMPTRSSTICSTHFYDSDFDLKKSGYRYLKMGAIPHRNVVTVTTCLPQTSTSGARNTSIKLTETGKEVQDCQTAGQSADKPEPRLVQEVPEIEECDAASNFVDKSRAEQVQEIPEGKMIIARVYHYFKNEYEILKAFTGNHWEMNPLANYLQRTAEATGVSEQAVTTILEDKKDSGGLEHVPVQEKCHRKEPEVDSNDERLDSANDSEELKPVRRRATSSSVRSKPSDEEQLSFPSPIQLRVHGVMEMEYKTESADDECSPTVGDDPLGTGESVDRENVAATITKIKEESNDETEMLHMEQSINIMICDALQTTVATVHVKAEPSSPAD